MTRCSTLAVSNFVSTPVLTLLFLLLMVSFTTQVQAKPASPPQYAEVNEENSQDNIIKVNSLADSQDPQLNQVTMFSSDSRSLGSSGYSMNTRAARSDWSADSLHIIEESARNPRGARSAKPAEPLVLTNVSTRNPRGARH